MAASIPEEHRRGRYLLSQRLGVGDVAEVYLAQLEGEGGFRRDIVLKCLRPELGREPERVRLFLWMKFWGCDAKLRTTGQDDRTSMGSLMAPGCTSNVRGVGRRGCHPSRRYVRVWTPRR